MKTIVQILLIVSYHSVLSVQHYGQIHVAFKQRLPHAHLVH